MRVVVRNPINTVLLPAVVGLTGIAVGSALLISASASFKNTAELTEKRSEQTVATIKRGVGDNLAPAQKLIQDIARRFADGSLDLADRNRLAAKLSGVLVPPPQLYGVVICQPNAEQLWITRTAGGKVNFK